MAMFPPTIQHYPVALCFEELSVTWKTRKKGQEESTGYEGMSHNQVLVFNCIETQHRHLQLDPASLSWQQLPVFVQAPEGSQKADVHHWCSWRQEHNSGSSAVHDQELMPWSPLLKSRYSKETFCYVILSLPLHIAPPTPPYFPLFVCLGFCLFVVFKWFCKLTF